MTDSPPEDAGPPPSDRPAPPAGPIETEEAQAPVVAFLAEPAHYGGTAPAHVTTHISHVFVGPDRALKLIRARALPFLDARDPERRRVLAETGVAVNRRIAPEIYRGVRAVAAEGGRLVLRDAADGAPPERILDHVVDMNAFDPDTRLDRVLARGALDARLVERAADRIAAMHRSAPVRRVSDGAARVGGTIAQLVQDLEGLGASGDLAARIEAWGEAARAADRRLGGLLDRRGRHGFVRRCHGDLHLANICLWEGEPTPFDAIEFDEAMATIDVLYDLAFVLADLSFRGADAFANRLLCRYLEWTRDYAGLAALPVFASMRAMVRALVAAASGGDPSGQVALAGRLVAGPGPARLLAVGGRSGTGKSTLARALAERTGAVVLRSDAVRKRLFGRAPEDRLPEAAYAEEASRRVYRRMRVDAARALRAGFPVVLDATFLDPDERAAAADLAARAHVAFDGIWLSDEEATLAARLAARAAAGTDASDADAAVMRAQRPAAAPPAGWHAIDAGGPPGAVAAAAASAVGLAPAP